MCLEIGVTAENANMLSVQKNGFMANLFFRQ